MKTYSIDEIVGLVRTKLDEIGLNESEMMDALADNTNLDTVIKSCIPDACRFVLTNADESILDGKSAENEVTLEIDEDLVGRFDLPQDLIRVLNVRLSSWNSSFSNVIGEGSPEYRIQSNKWICGSSDCPVMALIYRNSGRRLELFKAKSRTDTLVSFVYVPMVDLSGDSISLPEKTYESFIYYICYLVMVTFRDESAQEFLNVSRSLLVFTSSD